AGGTELPRLPDRAADVRANQSRLPGRPRTPLGSPSPHRRPDAGRQPGTDRGVVAQTFPPPSWPAVDGTPSPPDRRHPVTDDSVGPAPLPYSLTPSSRRLS